MIKQNLINFYIKNQIIFYRFFVENLIKVYIDIKIQKMNNK
jgi:hypothetical protein